MAALLPLWRTTHHTTFSLICEPQTVPLRLTQRNSYPLSIRAAVSQSSTAAFTQSGIGIVCTRPPLPNRSVMAQ
jgi:hypothetical protein